MFVELIKSLNELNNIVMIKPFVYYILYKKKT